MKLVVGLGNPGKKYEVTRHNAGWLTLDLLLDKYGYSSVKEEHSSIVYTSTVDNEKVLFVKPQTFMNNSGFAVTAILNYYKIDIKDLIIIHDDKDFEIGKNQFKIGGSSAGHNGIKSIIEQLGTQDFKRLRIGIGTVPQEWLIIDWVLSKFTKNELDDLTNSIGLLLDFVKNWIKDNDFKKYRDKNF